jgi:hypothetical protein
VCVRVRVCVVGLQDLVSLGDHIRQVDSPGGGGPQTVWGDCQRRGSACMHLCVHMHACGYA